jgi:ABC-type branched-subunit amino acid transport system substrate-binding protein
MGQRSQQAVLTVIDWYNEAAPPGIPRLHPLIFSDLPGPEAIRAAARSGAVAILGGATSTLVASLAPLAQRGGIPWISPFSNAPLLAISGDLLFRWPSDSGMKVLGAYARRSGMSSYSVLLSSENLVYACSALEDFAEGSRLSPRAIRAVRSAGDLPRVLKGFEERGDLLIVLPDFLAGLAVQMARRGAPGRPLWLAGGGISDRSAALAGPLGEGARGVVLYDPDWGRTADASSPFLRFYRERYGAHPDPSFLCPAYGALGMLIEAVRLGGVDRDGLTRGLKELRRVKGEGSFEVNAAGDGLQPYRIVRLAGGRWVREQLIRPGSGGAP